MLHVRIGVDAFTGFLLKFDIGENVFLNTDMKRFESKNLITKLFEKLTDFEFLSMFAGSGIDVTNSEKLKMIQ